MKTRMLAAMILVVLLLGAIHTAAAQGGESTYQPITITNAGQLELISALPGWPRYSPSGQYLANVTGTVITIRDAASLETLASFGFENRGGIGGEAFDPVDETLLALLMNYGDIEIVNVESGEIIATLEAPEYSSLLKFSPDGRYLVIASDNGGAQLVDTNTWEPERVFEATGGLGFTRDVAFSADGTTLMGIGLGVVYWDLESGDILKEFYPDPYAAYGFLFPDDRHLFIQTYRNATIWDVATETMVAEIDNLSNCGRHTLQISPDNNWMVLTLTGRNCRRNRYIEVVNIQTGASLLESGRTPYTFSSDSTLLAMVDRSSLEFYDLASGQLTMTWDLSQTGLNEVDDIALLPGASLLALGGYTDSLQEGTLLLYDLATQTEVGRYSYSGMGYDGFLQLTPDQTRLGVTTFDGTYWMWGVPGAGSEVVAAGASMGVNAIAPANLDALAVVNVAHASAAITGRPVFSPEGTLVLASDGGWQAYDTATAQPVSAPAWQGQDLVFSPDGSLLAQVTGPGTVQIVDVASDDVQQTLTFEADAIQAVAFSADSLVLNVLQQGTDERRILSQADLASGDITEVLRYYDRDTGHAAFSPDGSLLVYTTPNLRTAEGDQLNIFGTATGAALFQRSGLNVLGIAFNADGHWLALLSEDDIGARELAIMNTQTFAATNRWTDWNLPEQVRDMAFNPAGSLIALVSATELSIWDVEAQTALFSVQPQREPFEGVKFSPDGETLITTAENDTAWFWRTDTGGPVTATVGITGSVDQATTAVYGLGLRATCPLAAGEHVLALGRSADGMALVLAGGVGCEGSVWIDPTTATWDDSAALEGLPLLLMPYPTEVRVGAPDAIPVVSCDGASGTGTLPSHRPPFTLSSGSSNLPADMTTLPGIPSELTICVDYQEVVYNTCLYEGGYQRTRKRIDLNLTLMNVRTGGILAQTYLPGEQPAPCPDAISIQNGSGSGSIRGSYASDDEQLAWALQVLAQRTIARSTVNTGSLNARSEPNTNAMILTQLPYGTPLNIIGRNETGDWLLVLTPEMQKAWVSAPLVTLAQLSIETLPTYEGDAAAALVPILQD